MLLNNGKKSSILVPVKDKSSNKTINSIKVDHSQPWKKKLLNKLSLNYRKAPYYDETMSLVTSILDQEHAFIHELNIRAIKGIVEHLEIQTDILTDNSAFSDLEDWFDQNEENELLYNGKMFERKVIRVLEVCKRLGANEFINAIGGTELYKKEIFRDFGIALKFVKTDNNLNYPQHYGDFNPSLSIIDVLMFNGKIKTKELIKRYTLI